MTTINFCWHRLFRGYSLLVMNYVSQHIQHIIICSVSPNDKDVTYSYVKLQCILIASSIIFHLANNFVSL